MGKYWRRKIEKLDYLVRTVEGQMFTSLTNLCKVRSQIFLAAVACCFISTSVAAHPGSGIGVDRMGQVYFLDTGSGLWKIDTTGRLTHLSELRHHWMAVDSNSGFANAR